MRSSTRISAPPTTQATTIGHGPNRTSSILSSNSDAEHRRRDEGDDEGDQQVPALGAPADQAQQHVAEAGPEQAEHGQDGAELDGDGVGVDRLEAGAALRVGQAQQPGGRPAGGPVEEIGRYSVMPSTTPRIAACHQDRRSSVDSAAARPSAAPWPGRPRPGRPRRRRASGGRGAIVGAGARRGTLTSTAGAFDGDVGHAACCPKTRPRETDFPMSETNEPDVTVTGLDLDGDGELDGVNVTEVQSKDVDGDGFDDVVTETSTSVHRRGRRRRGRHRDHDRDHRLRPRRRRRHRRHPGDHDHRASTWTATAWPTSSTPPW